MTAKSSLRILIGDPYRIVCEGVASVLNCQPDMQVVGQAHSGQRTLELFAELQPDVVVMERDFPDRDGMQIISTLHKASPATSILIFSLQEGDECIYSALQAGARGYCFKNVTGEGIAEAIRTMQAGKMALDEHVLSKLAARVTLPDLSSREKEVLLHLTAGQSNKEIAHALFVTEGTVKSHINSILGKLRVSDRTQAVLSALERGLVKLP